MTDIAALIERLNNAKWMTANVMLVHRQDVADAIAVLTRLDATAADLLAELAHLVSLLEPLELSGAVTVRGLATLNGARGAIAKAKGQA